ncbi:hypothetical protein ACOTFF_16405 [Achromobacter xylosoxidans]
MDTQPISPRFSNPAIQADAAQSAHTTPLDEFNQLIRTYVQQWQSESADGSTRDAGSVQRLAANTLATIAWADRNIRGASDGDARRFADQLKQSLDLTCAQEEIESHGSTHNLANEIVNTLRNAKYDETPSSATVAMVRTVLKEIGQEQADVAGLLRTMETNAPTNEWAIEAGFSDPIYRYSLTAWAHLGPSDEITSRMQTVKKIFQSPNYVDVSEMGLTGLPTLPECLNYLNVYDNRITKLPALPEGLEELSVDNNELTSLPVLPKTLQKLEAFCNDFDLDLLSKSLQFLKPGTMVWFDGYGNDALQAKLEGLMNKLRLDAEFYWGHGG